MEGQGCSVFRESGDTFEGPFVDGKQHGIGTYTSKANGRSYVAEYEAGKLVRKEGASQSPS